MCNVFALPEKRGNWLYMDKVDLNCHISVFMVGNTIKYDLRWSILMMVIKDGLVDLSLALVD
jgi:hypothetical protein